MLYEQAILIIGCQVMFRWSKTIILFLDELVLWFTNFDDARIVGGVGERIVGHSLYAVSGWQQVPARHTANTGRR